MSYRRTTATEKLLRLNKRIRAICGGTSASKTISILMILIDYSQTHEDKKVDVVSESYPHLSLGAMADFLSIMKEQGYWKQDNWNESKHIYTFETGTVMRFYSVDTYGKAHGPRRDVLFVNEANNIQWNIFDQLRARTKEVIWLDWNPSNEFWYYEHIKDKIDHDFMTLTYLDNEGLDQNIVDDIESHRDNKNWWAVYGLGQLGEVEGKIYKDWKIIDEIPHEARLERRGLDFGFSNDPSALVDVYYYNGGYILDERLYRKGMHNNELASYIQNLEHQGTVIIGDSAEPKSISEIQQYGLPIIPVVKKGVTGKSYLKHSIDYVQQQRISVTKRSTNLIKEYRNYLWLTDVDGKILNEPTPGNDHALDATRYAFDGLRPQEEETEVHTSGNIKSLWY